MSATITNAAMVLFPERQPHGIMQAPEGGGTMIGAHHDEIRLIPEQDAAGAAPEHLVEEHLPHPDRFFVCVCAILLKCKYSLSPPLIRGTHRPLTLNSRELKVAAAKTDETVAGSSALRALRSACCV